MIEAVGLLAALLTASSLVPQVWRIVRTKETTGVSRRTYMLTAAASTLWITYGAGIASPSVILCNSAIGLLALTSLALKLSYG